MDPALQERIDQIANWVDESKDFIAQQAPLVVQEILNWESAVAFAYAVVPLVLLVLFLRATRVENFDDFFDPGHVRFIRRIFVVAPTVVAGYFCLYGVMGLVKVWVAPRMVVLDVLRGYL